MLYGMRIVSVVSVHLIGSGQNFLTDRSIPMINENALSNILVDVDFLEDTLSAMGHEDLNSSFTELRAVRIFSCVLLIN